MTTVDLGMTLMGSFELSRLPVCQFHLMGRLDTVTRQRPSILASIKLLAIGTTTVIPEPLHDQYQSANQFTLHSSSASRMNLPSLYFSDDS